MGIGAIFNAPTVATRHMLDINLFGVASDRYNARNEYRTNYTDTQRWAAGVGVAAGATVPVLGLAHWGKPGVLFTKGFDHWKGVAFQVPEFVGGWQRNLAVGVGVAAAGGVAYVGQRKVRELVADDGHFGSVGSLAGMVGGYAAGYAGANLVSKAAGRFAPQVGPIVGGLLAIGGGIAGYKLGERMDSIGPWKAGPGAIGKPIADQTPVADGYPGTVRDYGRGFFNHFNEAGPSSQGISFGNAWRSREAVSDRYSKAELSGGMGGELAAAAILGGGALTGAARLTRGLDATHNVSSIAEKASLANRLFEKPMTAQLMGAGGLKKSLIGAGAVGLMAAGGYYTYKAWSDDGKNPVAGGIATAALGVAGLAAYRAGMKSGFGAAAGKARPMVNLVAVATLVSAMSAAQWPIRQYVNHAQMAWDKHGAPGKPTMIGATAAGVLAGGAAGMAIGKSFTAGPLKYAGMAAGAIAGGAAGFGISPTLPEGGSLALGAGVGAAALGALTLGLTRGRPGVAARAAKMAAFGAVAGGLGSAVLAGGQKPTTPQSVGTA